MIRRQTTSFHFSIALSGLRAGVCRAGTGLGTRARIHQGELHEVRISHSDARRRPSLHGGLRSEGSIAAISDHTVANAIQRASRTATTRTGAIWVPRLFSARTATSWSTRTSAAAICRRGSSSNMRPHREQERPARDRREQRHVRHDRLADQECRGTTTERSGIWGISYPGFLHGCGHDRRASGAQGGVSTGAGDRLVRGRRLASQRRVVPPARVSIPGFVRPSAAGADHGISWGEFDAGTPDGYDILPADGAALERQRVVFQGRCTVLEGDDGARHLR